MPICYGPTIYVSPMPAVSCSAALPFGTEAEGSTRSLHSSCTFSVNTSVLCVTCCLPFYTVYVSRYSSSLYTFLCISINFRPVCILTFSETFGYYYLLPVSLCCMRVFRTHTTRRLRLSLRSQHWAVPHTPFWQPLPIAHLPASLGWACLLFACSLLPLPH